MWKEVLHVIGLDYHGRLLPFHHSKVLIMYNIFTMNGRKNDNNYMNSSDIVTYVCLMDTHSREVKNKKQLSKVLISRFATVLTLVTQCEKQGVFLLCGSYKVR